MAHVSGPETEIDINCRRLACSIVVAPRPPGISQGLLGLRELGLARPHTKYGRRVCRPRSRRKSHLPLRIVRSAKKGAFSGNEYTLTNLRRSHRPMSVNRSAGSSQDGLGGRVEHVALGAWAGRRCGGCQTEAGLAAWQTIPRVVVALPAGSLPEGWRIRR
jgi:hypothetical protein